MVQGIDFSKMDLVGIQEFVSVIEETDDWDNADPAVLKAICRRLQTIFNTEGDGDAERLETFIRSKF